MEKIPPQDTNAEKGVLGSSIIDSAALVHVLDFLRPEHFYRDTHRIIYETILALYRRHEPADLITLNTELERRGKLDIIGGFSYLISLTNCVPTSGNIEYYGRIVERKWVHRELIRAAGEIASMAYQEEDQALSRSEEMVYRIGQQRTGENATISHREALSQYIEVLTEIHERTRNGVITGVPTGFRFLDKKLGGLRPSDLIILAARPAVGKTALALNIGDYAVRSGYQVLLFSMEMAKGQLMQRWMAMEAQIDSTKLRDGKLSDDEWEQLIEAGARLDALDGTMWINDTCGLSSTAMRSKARRTHAESGLDLIIVDYLQIGKAPNEDGQKYENRRLEVEEVCRSLKMLARELDIPVLSLAQLSRAVEQRAGHVPQLSDLREAGGIEADADVVMFIHKDPVIAKDAPQYNVDIIVDKHRNGATGIVPLHFIANQTRYETITMTEVA